MGKFTAFMKENVEQTKDVSLKLERFSEPIKLRALTSGEADKINERSFINKTGRKGRQERVFDATGYNRGICTASVVYPDLTDASLQESYGVRGAESLYSVMFLLGEATQILEKVTEISGLDIAMDDEIEEAKN